MLLNNLNKNKTEFHDVTSLTHVGNSLFVNSDRELLLQLDHQGIVINGLTQHLQGGVGIDNDTWLDQSGNNNNGLLVNSPGVASNYIELDGIDNYISVDTSNSLDVFTISMTIEYLSLTNKDRLLNQISNVGGTWSLYAINNAFGGSMEFYTNPLWHDTEFTPVVNEKYTIDFVIDNINQLLKVYVNAVLVTTINDNVNYTDLGIGNKYRGIYGTYAHLRVYDYKHYNRALTEAELTQNYNAITN